MKAACSLPEQRTAELKAYPSARKHGTPSAAIYTALQGGSIMHGWMKDDRVMIACCNDGTRPVIFKIERIDVE